MAKSENPTNIQQYLSGVNYPAKKNDLVSTARKNNAPNDVIQQLQNMPDREFKQATDVQELISGRTKGGQTGQTGQSGQTGQAGQKGQSGGGNVGGGNVGGGTESRGQSSKQNR